MNVPNIYQNLHDQQQFRLNKISEVRDYFITEIRESELMSKRLSKYIASFDYFDKSSIILSATSGSISIASFATVTGAPVGIMSASCSLAFSITTQIVKKLLKTARNKKKKHNKIVVLDRSKLNSIESKISEAMKLSEATMNEEKKYRELKESIWMMNT